MKTFGSCFTLFALLAFGSAPLGATTPAFIQETVNQISSGIANSVALSSPTAAGSLIVVYVIWDNTCSVSVSDSAGNTYASAVGPTQWNSDPYSAQVFYAINRNGGADAVTATFSTAVMSFGIVYVHEYSGVDQTAPIDVTAAASGSSSSLDSGFATTTSADDLIFGAGVSDNIVTAEGFGFTVRDLAFGNITEDLIGSSPGPYAATATHQGKMWAMQMVAFRAAGGSSDTTAPTVPTGLSASVLSSSQIDLSWNASTDPVDTSSQLSYTVYRNHVQVARTTGGTTSWQDTGLAASTTYTYAVSAQNPAGNSSTLSASVQATTPALILPAITSFNVSPESIIAGQTATLSWALSNVTSVTIDPGVGTVTGANSATVSPAVTTIYTLTAANSAGSTTAQATVTVSPGTPSPTVPLNLTAVAVSTSQINLSWAASTGNSSVTGYYIYRNGVQIATIAALTFSDTGLGSNTTYTYTVSAYEAAGNTSAQSAPASATTLGADTQAPTVSITSPSNNQTISGTVTITADAADNVGVVGVQFELDGATLGVESTTAPYSTILNTIQAGNGSHLLTAVARDAAGNTTTSSGVIVTVNKVSLRPYTTNFPLNENPISEGGNWMNGQTVGLDWADISTSSGLAKGSQSGFGGYDDSTALLTGVWGPDQTAEATVRTTNQNSGAYEEVEIRLRSSISAHSNTGYEINFRCLATGDTYSQIVRWNGPLGDFTLLNSSAGPGLNDGDVVKATVIGNVITAYINGRAIVSVTDDTFSGGNPGMGFYVQGATGVNQDFGFTSFSASDGSTADNAPPSTPTNLSAIAIASSRIDLSWTPSTDDVGVAGYLVFRDNNQIASTTITRISDTGLSAITQYAYTVLAFDAAGNVSTQSAQVIATTAAPDTTAPPVPVDLQSSNITSSSLIVAWSEPAGDVAVARYQVFRDGIQVATTTATSYADSGLAPLTTYAYTIAAYGYAGIGSVQSQQLLVTTTAAPLTPPSLVQVTQNQIVSGTGVSVGLNTPSQSGNTIVAYVIWDNAGSVVLTDSGGDVFVSVGGPTSWGNGYSAQVFYASNIAGGVDTVTATFRNSVASFGVVYIHEYAGISAFDPVDVTAAASGSSASLNSGLATTTSANDLIFGAGVSDNFVTAAGSDFTPRNLAYGNITEDRSASSPGPYAATAIHNGKMWGMQMVAFRAAN